MTLTSTHVWEMSAPLNSPAAATLANSPDGCPLQHFAPARPEGGLT